MPPPLAVSLRAALRKLILASTADVCASHCALAKCTLRGARLYAAPPLSRGADKPPRVRVVVSAFPDAFFSKKTSCAFHPSPRARGRGALPAACPPPTFPHATHVRSCGFCRPAPDCYRAIASQKITGRESLKHNSVGTTTATVRRRVVPPPKSRKPPSNSRPNPLNRAKFPFSNISFWIAVKARRSR